MPLTDRRMIGSAQWIAPNAGAYSGLLKAAFVKPYPNRPVASWGRAWYRRTPV